MPNHLGLRTADISRGNLRRIEEFPGFLLVSDTSPETPLLTHWPRLNLILWPETLDWSSRMRFLPIIPVECIVSGNMYTEVVAVKCCSRTPIAPGAIPRALEIPKHSGAESPLREVSGMPNPGRAARGHWDRGKRAAVASGGRAHTKGGRVPITGKINISLQSSGASVSSEPQRLP